MIIKGRIPENGKLVASSITVSDGIIEDITPAGDENLPLILPGFIDVHTHGGGGIDVNHLRNDEDIEALSSFYASRGVTSVLLSVMTDTKEEMMRLVSLIGRNTGRKLPGAEIMGIHLEGPFLSEVYKGCMPSSLILDPDTALFDSFCTASGGNVRYITIAPERKGALEFIRHAADRGIVVSMGHSDASYEEAVEAIEAGVTSATHLFNAMKLFHMHRPAISGAALESDDVYCEIISDGFHLHPATVRLVLKTKGVDHVVAITDSIMAAGLPDGSYMLGVNPVVVRGGDAQTPEGVRAGSTLTLDRALRNLVSFTGMGVEKIWPLLSKNQSDMLHLSDRGVIEKGRRADFVVLDDSLCVMETMVKGITVYKRKVQ